MKIFAISALFVLVLGIGLAPSLHAAGATIIKGSGELFYGPSIYRGDCTSVKTPDGTINMSCHLTLDSGDPVEQETEFDYDGLNPFGPPIPCEAELTPSGNAEVSCHN
jgi:hypothetical protein